MLEIRWRRWLTDRYLRAWLADGAYYRMQLVAHETDNPDQRIAEDVHLLASHTLGLFIGGLRAIVTLVTFVAILWGLSGTLTVPVGVVLRHRCPATWSGWPFCTPSPAPGSPTGSAVRSSG